ncbi:MAG: hypothetical protein ACTSYR_00055 [Candidatus Odinarchaeia archaeon]
MENSEGKILHVEKVTASRELKTLLIICFLFGYSIGAIAAITNPESLNTDNSD